MGQGPWRQRPYPYGTFDLSFFPFLFLRCPGRLASSAGVTGVCLLCGSGRPYKSPSSYLSVSSVGIIGRQPRCLAIFFSFFAGLAPSAVMRHPTLLFIPNYIGVGEVWIPPRDPSTQSDPDGLVRSPIPITIKNNGPGGSKLEWPHCVTATSSTSTAL